MELINKKKKLNRSAASGNQEAFLKVYDEYAKKIYTFVYYRVSSKADAEDLTSQVFLRTWEYLGRGSEGKIDNFGAFLFRTARNLVVDHYRAKKQTVGLETIENSLEFSETPDFNGFDREHDQRSVVAALNRLNEDEREIITMRFISEMTVGEISKITKKNKNNIYVIIFRSLKKLKKMLQKENV
jgi:RNA polymerase sigma-70 factor (ECF subfamily)